MCIAGYFQNFSLNDYDMHMVAGSEEVETIYLDSVCDSPAQTCEDAASCECWRSSLTDVGPANYCSPPEACSENDSRLILNQIMFLLYHIIPF